MKKRVISITLAVLAAMSLAACGNSSATQTSTSAGTTQPAASADTAAASDTAATADAGSPAQGGSFTYALATEVDNFDPFTATTADAKSIYFNIYEGLVKVQPDGTFTGAVASDYSMDSAGKTWTFTLRDGIRFHNGNEVTADDVLYSIQLAIDSQITGYDNIDTFEQSQDNGSTVITITLKNADTDFLSYATQAIVPKDSDSDGELATAPIGTGPFKFTEYKVQDHVTLERFDDYWGTPAYLDTVTVRFLADSSQELVNFQSGAIDGFTADASITEQVDKSTAVFNVGNSNAVQALYLNNAAAPFDDVRVRQAVAYAVDPQDVIDTVDYGYGTKVGTAMIPGLSVYFDDSLTDVYSYDPEKAKELLAEAGYPDGIEFSVTVPSVYKVHVDSAQVLVNDLAAAGITMNIEQVDWATWLENTYTNRDYEATIVSVDSAIASPTGFLSRYVSDAGNNFVNFQSDDFDQHYQAAVSASDQETRETEFKACEKILSDEAASAYIQDIANILVYSQKFGGYVGYPLYAIDFSAIYQVQ